MEHEVTCPLGRAVDRPRRHPRRERRRGRPPRDRSSHGPSPPSQAPTPQADADARDLELSANAHLIGARRVASAGRCSPPRARVGAPLVRTSPTSSTPARSVEYPPARSTRPRSAVAPREELIARTPADGLIGGVAKVDGPRVHRDRPTTYMVLAGTQGHARAPEEGPAVRTRCAAPSAGGVVRRGRRRSSGRHGHADRRRPATAARSKYFARLSGGAPLVGIAAGFCFAGNAALLGCCDVVIATERRQHRHGRPGDDRGRRPRASSARRRSGRSTSTGRPASSTSAVPDEAAAVRPRRRYLALLLGCRGARPGAEDAALRTTDSRNRRRAYDVRAVVEALRDTDSVLELRGGFGRGIVTALGRVEGRALGVVANDPAASRGRDRRRRRPTRRRASCSSATPSACRCCSLCDTPGFMVGPAVRADGDGARTSARMFLTGANLSVPAGTIVLRKGYGLGSQAMAAGGFKAPQFTVAWPTASSARWASRAPCGSGCGASSRPSPTRTSGEQAYRGRGRSGLRARPGREHGRPRRDRRCDRPRRLAPLDRHAVRRTHGAAGSRPNIEAW